MKPGQIRVGDVFRGDKVDERFVVIRCREHSCDIVDMSRSRGLTASTSLKSLYSCEFLFNLWDIHETNN